MKDLAAFITPSKSISDAVGRVKVAEDLGYDSVFATQIAGRDALMSLSAYAAGTERIGIGTGVLPAFPRHPLSLAIEAATLDEISGGRLNLGLGTSHAVTMQGWYGFEFAKPLTQLKEYMHIVREVITTGKVAHQGDFYTANFVFQGFEPRADMPIYISGLGPNTLKFAGEAADGVILWCCLPSYIRDTVVPAVRAGEKAAGREPGSCKIVAAVPSLVTSQQDKGHAALRRDLLVYWTLPFYRNVIGAAGFADEIAAFDELLKSGDAQGATGKISDRFLNEIGGIGDAASVSTKIEEYREAGADLPAVGMIAVPRDVGTPEETMTAAIK